MERVREGRSRVSPRPLVSSAVRAVEPSSSRDQSSSVREYVTFQSQRVRQCHPSDGHRHAPASDPGVTPGRGPMPRCVDPGLIGLKNSFHSSRPARAAIACSKAAEDIVDRNRSVSISSGDAGRWGTPSWSTTWNNPGAVATLRLGQEMGATTSAFPRRRQRPRCPGGSDPRGPEGWQSKPGTSCSTSSTPAGGQKIATQALRTDALLDDLAHGDAIVSNWDHKDVPGDSLHCSSLPSGWSRLEQAD